MNRKPLKIGNKTAALPLIQGGMGIGVSLSRLAGSVAKAGGVGILSAAQIGFQEPDFEQNPKTANLRAIRTELEKARNLSKLPDGTCPGLLGFNIMTATRDYADYVHAAAQAGADVIISGAGLPMDLPAYVDGTDTAIAPVVSSEKAARLILKRWEKRYGRTADFLVIENAHAGGHLGFSKEQLSKLSEPDYEAHYDQEIQRILSCVREYEQHFQTTIPVITAGGIAVASQAEHFFSLGADGIQAATIFIATEECDADPAYKEAFLRAHAEDIELVNSPVGMPARAIHNAFLEQIQNAKEPVTKCYRCLNHCNPKETPYCITKALIRAVRGDVEHGLLFCGDQAPLLDRIKTVPEVIAELLP